MPRQINWQLILLLALTILSLFLVYPTARYFHFVSNNPAPQSGTEAEKEYDARVQDLKQKSITLGLDLQGGVDILLSVDQQKTELDNLTLNSDRLKQLFRSDSIDATFNINKETNALELALLNPKDYRAAKNILDNWSETFAEFTSAPLEEGKPIMLKLASSVLATYNQDALEGSEEVLRNRVDEFGLTQATVVRQGFGRIRVQIPGEKDPMKVIDNMLRPAQLQFRMVHAENDSRVGKLVEERVEDGQTIRTVKTADVPPGYRVFFGKITRPDPGRPGTKITETIPYLLSDDVPLDGKNLKENYVQIVQSDLESPIHINLVFDRKGSSTFKELTEKNVGRQLAILLDNEVYTAPRIKDPIPDGRCYISGSFDMEEARLVNQVLKAGSMPARLQVEHKQTVGASLGTDTIRSSVKVLIVGAALVIAFMIVYYGAAGLIADIALIINVLMILAVLSMARAALTLSGIGGILLTIGMAVDANVLIYERIREEVSDGKPVKVAVKRGFDRAFTVIWDSNFTTLITALILLQFATGSVKGFALTMAIGLLVNLYTGLNVTHTLTDMWVTWRNHISLGALKIFRNTKFNFISARYGAYILSGVLLVAGIGALIVNGGPHYGVDFEGGILAQVQFREKVGGDDIRAAFSGMGMNIPRVQRVTGTEEFLLRIKMQDNDGAKTQSMMEDVLQKKFGAASYEIRSVQQVGNEIGEEFRWIALKSVLIASLAILIYVGFRFQFVFGMGAVIALLHDVLVVIGLLTIFGRDITLDVVSAILMIIGYSINDTIVIFDRIRENMRSVTGSTFKEIANLSINQSMSRTFLTSATTFFPMFIMFFFGGKGLADFALTICMGIIVGTYSSSFIATPLVYEWIKRKGFHAVEEKSTKTHFRTVDPLANQ